MVYEYSTTLYRTVEGNKMEKELVMRFDEEAVTFEAKIDGKVLDIPENLSVRLGEKRKVDLPFALALAFKQFPIWASGEVFEVEGVDLDELAKDLPVEAKQKYDLFGTLDMGKALKTARREILRKHGLIK